MRNNTLYKLSPLFVASMLTACGGSSSSVDPRASVIEAPQPAKAGQPVTFNPSDDASPVSIVRSPEKGLLTEEDGGKLTYNPGEDFQSLAEGEIEEVSFSYSDGENTYKKSIKVTGTNDKPVTESFSLRMSQDSASYTGQLKVQDPDSSDVHQFTIVSQPQLGHIELGDGGQFEFIPNSDFPTLDLGESQEISFTYRASDSSGQSSSDTSDPSKVSIEITGGDFGDNSRPEAQDLSLAVSSVEQAIVGSFEVEDPDGDTQLTIKIVQAPAKGQVEVHDDASFTYIPSEDLLSLASGKIEEISFTYQVVDSSGKANDHSEIKTVTIPVSGSGSDENAQPIVSDLVFTVDAAATQVLEGQLLVKDADEGDLHSFQLISEPVKGFMSTTSTGYFTYNLGSDFDNLAKGDTLEVSVAYIATDSANEDNSTSEPARLSIVVTGNSDTATANKQPIVPSLTYDLNVDGSSLSKEFTVSDLDTDNKHEFIIINNVKKGSLTQSANGFIFDPLDDFVTLGFEEQEQVSFSYVAIDNAAAANSQSAEGVITINLIGVNQNTQPVLKDIVVEGGLEDGQLSGQFSVIDPDGAQIHSYSIVKQPSRGEVEISGASFTYNAGDELDYLAEGEEQTLSFTYVANDGSGSINALSNEAKVSFSVVGVNERPVANDNGISVYEDGEATSARFSASDADLSDIHTFSLVDELEEGQGKLSINGSAYTFSPESDFQYLAQDEEEKVAFTFKSTDSSGADNAESAAGTITITVTGVNDAPVAEDTTFELFENSPLTAALPVSDVDIKDVLTAPVFERLEGESDAGTLELLDDMQFKFTPDASFNDLQSGESRAIKFKFQADDQSGTDTHLSNEAIVTLLIKGRNAAPTAEPLSVSTDEDTALGIVLSGSDIEGDDLTYSVVTGPTNGSLSGTGAELSYTPAANFNGADSFTYLANDGMSDSEAVTVSITVNAVNDAPVADAKAVSTDEDTALAIVLSGSDLEGDDLSYSVITGPTNGSLSGTGATLTYTPSENYNGADSFTYIANDGAADSEVVTVSITVNAVNDAPLADAKTVSTDEDTALAIVLSGSDIEGDDLTYSVVSGPSEGSLSGSGAELTYTPAANYNGADSFTYIANDGSADSAPVTVSITVNAVNDAPVADAKAVSTDEDTSLVIVLSGSDIEGDDLTYSVVSGPSEGSLSGSGANLTYTPAANYNGADSFTYIANDGSADSAPVTVSITVNAVNDAPVADAKAVSTDEDTALAIVLSGSDIESDDLIYSVVNGPSEGSLSGSGADLTYIPAANYNGADSFTYTVSDGELVSEEVSVNISINPVNDAPTISGTPATAVNEDVAYATFTPIGKDVDDDDLSYSIENKPSWASFDSTTGALSGTPSSSDLGTYPNIVISVSDGALSAALPPFDIEVIDTNAPPMAVADSYTLNEGDTLTVNAAAGVLNNDSDPNGDAMTVSQVGDAPEYAAGFTFNPDGSFTYVHDGSQPSAASEDVSFSYSITDGKEVGNTVSVTITITAENDEPTVEITTLSTDEDNAISGVIVAEDEESPIDLTSFKLVSGPDKGYFTLAPDGSYTFDPRSNFNALVDGETENVTFQFTVSDTDIGNGVTTATIDMTIAVAGIDDLDVTGEGILLERDSSTNWDLYHTVNNSELERGLTVAISMYNNDSATYKNSFGYYFAEDDHVPTEGQLMLTNSKALSGDAAKTKLFTASGLIPANTTLIGFFLAPDGDNQVNTHNAAAINDNNTQANGYEEGGAVTFSTVASDFSSSGLMPVAAGKNSGIEFTGEGSYHGDQHSNATCWDSSDDRQFNYSDPRFNFANASEGAPCEGSGLGQMDQEHLHLGLAEDLDSTWVFGDRPGNNGVNDLYLTYKLIQRVSPLPSDADENLTGDAVYDQSATPILDLDDIINALGGNDILSGGKGSDLLTGGEGHDLFIWSSSDVVTEDTDVIIDFSLDSDNNDSIDLSALLTGATVDNIDDYISVSITKDRTASGGGLKEGDTILTIDCDGAGPNTILLHIELQRWGSGNEAGVGLSDWFTQYPSVWTDADDVLANPQLLLPELINSHNLIIN